LLKNVETGGASRTPDQIADTPRAADRSVEITPPTASNDASTYSVTTPTTAAAGTPAAGTPEAAPAQAGGANEAPAAAAPVEWDSAHGATVFNSNCMACHQATGQGIPGAFPPLAGHAADIYALDGGRTYLLDTVLFGLQGQITVNGAVYNGVMPAWGHLPDGDIADALNHVLTAWGTPPSGFTPFTAADVEARRPDALTSADVHAHRKAIGLQ
jgi:mono/diheme cytochrome c family protein